MAFVRAFSIARGPRGAITMCVMLILTHLVDQFVVVWGRLVMLDIGVTSPEAGGAGANYCAAMHRHRRHKCAPHLHELEVLRGAAYRPMIWSVFGRVFPESQPSLSTMVVKAARQRGLRDHRLVLRRICSAIGVAMARRAARMAHSCVLGLDSGGGRGSCGFVGCGLARVAAH